MVIEASPPAKFPLLTCAGHIADSGYTMKGQTDRATETTSNNGIGNPVIYTGMIRSTFRPSDGNLPDPHKQLKSMRLIQPTDSSIFQYLIPSNMMFARYLEESALIMQKLDMQRSRDLESEMKRMASEIRAGITKHGIVSHHLFGAMFAFEVDGYGSQVRFLWIVKRARRQAYLPY